MVIYSQFEASAPKLLQVSPHSRSRAAPVSPTVSSCLSHEELASQEIEIQRLPPPPPTAHTVVLIVV